MQSEPPAGMLVDYEEAMQDLTRCVGENYYLINMIMDILAWSCQSILTSNIISDG